tara:strand:- start:993 stop:1388 length:396 start_codon:yes stop_codon:yes gene_type:complete
MQQILIGIILVLGLGSYWLYNENNTLKANNKALEGAVATQEAAIESLQNDFSLQTQELKNITVKSQAAQRELSRYTEFIRNYQLTAKILADPVEMQRKINNGTKYIMEDIEKLSDTVDNLDDGLQLQPNSN